MHQKPVCHATSSTVMPTLLILIVIVMGFIMETKLTADSHTQKYITNELCRKPDIWFKKISVNNHMAHWYVHICTFEWPETCNLSCWLVQVVIYFTHPSITYPIFSHWHFFLPNHIPVVTMFFSTSPYVTQWVLPIFGDDRIKKVRIGKIMKTNI